jgi:hypothetical protein
LLYPLSYKPGRGEGTGRRAKIGEQALGSWQDAWRWIVPYNMRAIASGKQRALTGNIKDCFGWSVGRHGCDLASESV